MTHFFCDGVDLQDCIETSTLQVFCTETNLDSSARTTTLVISRFVSISLMASPLTFKPTRLSSTLANFSSSSGARNAEHWIVLDDIVSALEHEFHTTEAAEGAPATMDVGPIKQLEAIGIGNRAQPSDWI